ncbi:MAG: TlpA family protein disulfide reductase, partial [Oscillospiraceae bacterium]|nr:TlpA family protein disulfide reductase [Oscillospiraceae bacterium]
VTRYTVKIGGVLLVLLGVLMLTGYMNNVTGYLARISTPPAVAEETRAEAASEETAPAEEPDAEDDPADDGRPMIPALGFELTDQYGVTHTLEQYHGKVIFLNFWATWCPPCRAEMPDIQRLYEKYGSDDDEVAILAVATPGYNGEGDEESVKAFLTENGYTYPVLMDASGELIRYYGVSAIPTTFMIDAEGNIYGYVPGAMTEETMQSIIDQTLRGSSQ